MGAALDDDVTEKLAPAQAAGDTAQMKQILREIAPEAAPSASSTATANAGAVINVVSGRMGGGSPAPAAGSGRSGGDYKPDAFYVNGVMSYGHSKYDETTRLAGMKSDYRADTFAAQAMAGYAFNDIFTPEAGVRYTSVRQKSYTNALGARLASKTSDTLTWVAGVKAAKTFRKDSLTLTPDAKLALTYDAHRSGQSRTVTLANGASYVADGENMNRFGIELGAGVTFKVGGNTDIGVSYEGKFKKHYTDHTALLNVKYNF